MKYNPDSVIRDRDFFNIMGKNFKYITGGFVIVMCIFLGAMLQFTEMKSNDVYGSKRTILIVMLYAYPVFRIIRLVLAYRKDRLDEERKNF